MTTLSQPKDLPLERLASMDEKGHRVFLHPADTKGPFKRRRRAFQAVLLVLFLVLPWIEINGLPAVLLDIAQRRFSILGLAFWAHDAPMLLFVAAGVLFGVSLATAVFGRIWCGWACPETVFVEFVYRQIERLIEGNAVQRRRLDAAPWNANKLLRRGGKWLAFTLVTLVISHSFLAYFTGVDALAAMMRQNPLEHPGTFGAMAFLTIVLLFSFGWFREQFCIVMCPYGRMQSVLLDEHSKIVAYDVARGEPRRGARPATVPVSLPQGETELPMAKGESALQMTRGETALTMAATPQPYVPPLSAFEPASLGMATESKLTGDCIDCNRCVTACPTGMDIRRGLQLECINCMACIDACNEVMRNVHKPEGLIRYTSQRELEGKRVNHLRPRVLLLSAVLLGVVTGLGYVLATRPPIKAALFSARTTPYQTLDATAKDPLLSNQFNLTATNYTFQDGEISLSSPDPRVKIVTQVNPVSLAAGKEQKIGVFLTFPKSMLSAGKAQIKLNMATRAHNGRWQRQLEQEVALVGPF